jgi:hypothetical protein
MHCCCRTFAAAHGILAGEPTQQHRAQHTTPSPAYICIQVHSAVLVQHHVPHDIAALHTPCVAEVCRQEPWKVVLNELQDSCLVPQHLMPSRMMCLRPNRTTSSNSKTQHQLTRQLGLRGCRSTGHSLRSTLLNICYNWHVGLAQAVLAAWMHPHDLENNTTSQISTPGNTCVQVKLHKGVLTVQLASQ